MTRLRQGFDAAREDEGDLVLAGQEKLCDELLRRELAISMANHFLSRTEIISSAFYKLFIMSMISGPLEFDTVRVHD
jgi:hypothetical protein